MSVKLERSREKAGTCHGLSTQIKKVSSAIVDLVGDRDGFFLAILAYLLKINRSVI